jgi:biopolymer transport protein ExbD
MAFGNKLDDSDDVVSEINMVPLIDVMLVLLIIFIITVPVLTHSVNLDLPRASSTPVQTKPETIQLAVTSGGGVIWNQDPVSFAELEARLQAASLRKPQPEVHIRGDRSVAYEYVAQVMSAAQRAGMTKLGFVTEPQR